MDETTAHFRFDGDLVSMKIEKKIILEPEKCNTTGLHQNEKMHK